MSDTYKQFWQKGRTVYFVSMDGQVVSTTEPDAPERKFRTIATYNGKGYRRVRLQGRTFKVHRIVAEAFVPNPDHLPYVLHKDGNRENNHYLNLEWSSCQSNYFGKVISDRSWNNTRRRTDRWKQRN